MYGPPYRTGVSCACTYLRCPILQISLSMDNFPIAFDAYKVGMYQFILRGYVLLQEIPDK
jgi:hypothetical protein